MVVGKFTHLWAASRALKFHEAGGIPHKIEEHPEAEEVWWVVNAIPYKRGDEETYRREAA